MVALSFCFSLALRIIVPIALHFCQHSNGWVVVSLCCLNLLFYDDQSMWSIF